MLSYNRARQMDLRRQNVAAVMGLVAGQERATRAAIAQRSGLSKATVSVLVGELLKLGLLVERGPRAEGRLGRPGSELAVDGDALCGVGLEIGVDYLAVCAMDLVQRIRHE